MTQSTQAGTPARGRRRGRSNAQAHRPLERLIFCASTYSCERPSIVKTRHRVAAARLRQREPMPNEATSRPNLRRKAHPSQLICYYINSYLRPLDVRQSLFLFIKAVLTPQSWSGGHCPARMAVRMLVFHHFDGPTLNAFCIAGIVLLISAGLLGLTVGGIRFTRKTRQARPGPLALPINGLATLTFPAWAGVAAVAVTGARLLRRQQAPAPHFVSSLPPRGPPAAGFTQTR